MYVRLWTIQHEAAWEELQRTGILRADPARVLDKAFWRAYDWMAGQMHARLGESPAGLRYPLWAWYQWEGQRRRRDLRQSGYGPRGTPMVQITFEIAQEQVLLSEFDRWNTVLGGGYLAAGPEDWDAFCADPDPGRIESSWERAFELERWTPGWDASPGEQSIQAVFWELRLDQVRKVEHFTTR